MLPIAPNPKNFIYVPSQTRPGRYYRVTSVDDKPWCNCPDHIFRHKECKHIHFILEGNFNKNG